MPFQHNHCISISQIKKFGEQLQAEVEMSAGLYGSKDCIMHFVRTF